MTRTDDDANEQYNEKVLTTGAWIEKEFLEDVLGATLQDEIKVLDYSVAAAVGAGDNYLSILYKTSVTYTTSGSDVPQQKSLMIKGVPTAKILLDMIEEMGVFEKEIAMYTKALPSMQRLLKEYFTTESPHVAPESYKCSRPRTLVMEDLGASGYKMANRRDQLDYEHCLITLRTLARFHALSTKLYENDPELVVTVTKDFYDESNREKMEPFLESTYKALIPIMETWDEDAKFATIIQEISNGIYTKIARTVKPSKTFNCLNHGDMWVNNVMYKYDEDGNVTGAKLVDFQLSRYTTPATDLQYFIFTSPKVQVLESHLKDLLMAYHQALMGDLALLGLEVDYPFEQLEEDMLNTAIYGINTMVQILPLVISAPSDTFDLDGFTQEDINKMTASDDNPLTTNYKNPYYRKTVCQLLTLMESNGYLDAAREQGKLDEDDEEVEE